MYRHRGIDLETLCMWAVLPCFVILLTQENIANRPTCFKGIYSALGGDRKRLGKVKNDEFFDWRSTYLLFPGNIAYVWHSGIYSATFALGLESADLKLRSQIIWVKSNMVVSRAAYHPKHEPCFYAVRAGQKANWRGGRKQTTVWEIDYKDQDARTTHGTQKPVECMRRPILNHTKERDYVYEPFMGSGTTLIAAESINRICLGIELDPAYVDMAVERWQNYTGNNARLESTGQPFNEVLAAKAA